MQKFYIIVRNDIPTMNVGKMAAQVSHCTTKLASEIDLFMLQRDGSQSETREWLNDENIGTTIVMEGYGDDIKEFFSTVKKEFPKLYTNKVIDETYPFIVPLDVARCLNKSVTVDWDSLDENGNVKCTRKEWTCSGLFFEGTKEDNRKLRDLMTTFNINLM